MLTNSQILDLLARCETASGRVLTKIRHELQTERWMSAVWELVVGEAASLLGQIKYEVGKEGGRPDWLLQLQIGQRVWIEATFQFEPRETIRRPGDHPLYRSLQEKEGKARRAKFKEPFVVCVGTDRVSSLGSPQGVREQNRDRAIESFWEISECISAVVIVPVLLRSELFVGFAREARPIIRQNPKTPLPEAVYSLLQRLNFNRWEFSLWKETNERDVRQDLRRIIRQLGSYPVDQAVLGCPPDRVGVQHNLKGPVWSYTWHFHQLRIAKMGDSDWLFDEREVIGKFFSAEEAAEVASDDFQWFPAHVSGPSGIQLNPEKGVPSNLDEWQFDQ